MGIKIRQYQNPPDSELVGSTQAFYDALGFAKLFAAYYWLKYFEV
jgi:hypothetical protein